MNIAILCASPGWHADDWIEERGVPAMNSPRAIERSVDKFYTTALLQEAGLPTPETIVCEGGADAMAAVRAMGDVIVKPIFGSMGHGIVRVTDPDVAFRVVQCLEQTGAVFYMQRAVDHGGRDVRAFVVGGHGLDVAGAIVDHLVGRVESGLYRELASQAPRNSADDEHRHVGHIGRYDSSRRRRSGGTAGVSARGGRAETWERFAGTSLRRCTLRGLPCERSRDWRTALRRRHAPCRRDGTARHRGHSAVDPVQHESRDGAPPVATGTRGAPRITERRKRHRARFPVAAGGFSTRCAGWTR